ncbi:hypothetical protein, partial [Burkholderia gladioli]|uniref:hypothetical protein n=1 Tax=Burkholderia gladioli TaxID=28095 RepID=UPI001ABB8EDD
CQIDERPAEADARLENASGSDGERAGCPKINEPLHLILETAVLQQSPIGWAYVDYINSSGSHLLRWIKADDLAIKP